MPDESKNINTGGGAYFGGKVKAGRDVIGRDQVITVTTQQGMTAEDFRSLLAELRQLLPQSGLAPDTVEVRFFRISRGRHYILYPEKPANTNISWRLPGSVSPLSFRAKREILPA